MGEALEPIFWRATFAHAFRNHAEQFPNPCAHAHAGTVSTAFAEAAATAGAAQSRHPATATERAKGGHFPEVIALLWDRIRCLGTVREDSFHVGRRGDLLQLLDRDILGTALATAAAGRHEINFFLGFAGDLENPKRADD